MRKVTFCRFHHLSFFLLDVPVEMLIDNNVYLPKSTVLELRDEKDKVISENKRDGGGTVAVVDDQLQFL